MRGLQDIGRGRPVESNDRWLECRTVRGSSTCLLPDKERQAVETAVPATSLVIDHGLTLSFTNVNESFGFRSP